MLAFAASRSTARSRFSVRALEKRSNQLWRVLGTKPFTNRDLPRTALARSSGSSPETSTESLYCSGLASATAVRSRSVFIGQIQSRRPKDSNYTAESLFHLVVMFLPVSIPRLLSREIRIRRLFAAGRRNITYEASNSANYYLLLSKRNIKSGKV
jgi:hypothetical protein